MDIHNKRDIKNYKVEYYGFEERKYYDYKIGSHILNPKFS